MKITKRVGSTSIAKMIVNTCRAFWPDEKWDEMVDGLGYRVTFEKIKPQQTSNQQGYYWASLTQWGAEDGLSARECEIYLHNAVLCDAFGVKETKIVRGRVIEVPAQRSSRLSRDDYSLLIETMIRMAAENGYAVPPSEDYGT